MRFLLFFISLSMYGQFGAAKSVINGTGTPNAALCASANNVGRVYARKDGAAAGSTFYVCANTAASTYAWELAGTGSGGSGDATNPSGIEFPELSSNGTDLTWLVGATSLSATQCYQLPAAVGSYGKVLADTGTTVSLDPDGAGALASRTCRVLDWYNAPVQVKSAVYTLSIDNSTTLTSIAAISMPALAVGSQFDIEVSVKNSSTAQWEFQPRVGSTALFLQRDQSAGADTMQIFSARCSVFSTTSVVCGGVYLRPNGSQGGIDLAGGGFALADTNADTTAAWTLNIYARTLTNTTTDIPFATRVIVHAAN